MVSANESDPKKHFFANFQNRIADYYSDKNKRYLLKWIVLLIIGITLTLIPFFTNAYFLEILCQIEFYILLCLGLNIVVGYAGLLDLGYAAFFAVGAYTTGILTTQFHINFWLTIPVAILFSMGAGILIGGPTLRLRTDYLAIVTLGFGEIVRITARNLEITGRATGIVGIERPSLFGFTISEPHHFFYLLMILCLIAVSVSHRLQHSRLGRAWKYIREDEDAAEAMGINRIAIKLYAYVIGAVFGGVAGCFFAVKMTAISPVSFQFEQSVLILLGVVLGGMGKIPGVIVGAILLVAFPEIFRDIGNWRYFIFGVVMLIIMLYRPQGIWPERRSS